MIPSHWKIQPKSCKKDDNIVYKEYDTPVWSKVTYL